MSFATLYFGALWFLPDIIDLNKYKNDFSLAIEEQSGFKFSCEDIKLTRSLSPYLNVKMHHTMVFYPNGDVFLKLKDSELKVKLIPLIFKKIVVKDAKLTRPIINVTLYKDFSTSIEKYFDAAKSINTRGFSLDAIVKDTICERYKLKIQDETTGKLFHLEGNELLIKDVKLNEKIHLILKGSLYEEDTEFLKYDLDVSSPMMLKKQKFSFSPFKAILESDVKGEIAGKLVLDKNNNIDGYLNVDKLSLTANNTHLTDNKINLLFKGQEAQINSILHTSKTDIAEVNGKFSYGKKKNINLLTKAKNVDLKNLFEVVSLISQILNIQNDLKDFSVNGLLDADFSISSDFKKLKSNGSAKIMNANIVHSLLPYKISNVNANINLNDNKVVIENAQALVNSTPIRLVGTINEDVSVNLNATSENLNLATLVSLFKIKLPVEIKQGRVSFSSDISGKLDKGLKTVTNANIAGLSFIEKNLKQAINIKNTKVDLTLDSGKYFGEIVCSDLKTNINKKPISADSFILNFDDKKISVPENIVKLVNSDLKVVGSVLKNSGVDLSFDGNILASDIALFIDDYLNQPHKAIGKIKTSGKITSQNGNTEVKMQLVADENNYLSYAVIKELLNKKSLLDISLAFKDKELSLKDVSLYENALSKENKILSLNGKLKLGKQLIFDGLKINIPNIVSISTNFLGGEDISLNADLVVNNTIENPKLAGTVKIITCNIKKYLTAIKNADLTFIADSIKVVAPDIQINTSKLNIFADVDITKKEKFVVSDMQLHCATLDMNSLFELLEREANPFAKSLIEINKGVATINDFSILDLSARDISTDFLLKDNILKLSDISANAYMGQIFGALNYDIPHSRLELLLDGKNVSMKELLYDLCKISDNIAGRADFSTNVSLTTGEYNDVINSLNGKLDFTSINGKMGTLGKFEYYLYAQNVLYHGFLKTNLNRIADIFTKDNTANYRTANGTLLFEDGYMITDSIKTIGNDMSLFVKGRHNLISNQVNIDIYGRISDEITSKLGSFGNVSISDFLENQKAKTVNNIMVVPQNVISDIPLLYNKPEDKTKTFKVNLLGDINSLGAINSFMWIIPQQEKETNESNLPDFSQLQNL